MCGSSKQSFDNSHNSHFPPTIKLSGCSPALETVTLAGRLAADSAGDILEIETPSGRPGFWQIIDLC